MPYPYDVLSAAAYPAVTNARATGGTWWEGVTWLCRSIMILYDCMTHGFTGDYIDRDTQWAIGATQHGPQADCLAWKNRFATGSSVR